jgi:SAM-dependent methyltransferase
MMTGMRPTFFRKAAGDDTPSWYLDPLVAVQKRQVHQEWIRAAVGRRPCVTVLKTDLFEDAYGDDRIFHDLFPDMRLGMGFDINAETVSRAVRRSAGAFEGFVCDVRRVALPDARVDVVVSTSTLDHLESKRDIADSLDELSRVVRPEGIVIVTLDNPRNPFYFILKRLSRRGWTPFSLGATLSMAELEGMLVERGFHVEKRGYLIHNPRLLSTALFLGLRRVLGRHANPLIRWLLRAFMWLGRLPSQSFTGCFLAVSAVKRARAEEITG